VLIVEDDIEEREFHADIVVPAGADVAYLGGGTGGDLRGIMAACKNLPGRPIKRCQRYAYEEINADWIRIYGMLYGHAILYLNDRALAMHAASIDSRDVPYDVSLSLDQWKWNAVCRTIPFWWQNDGHHKQETWHYYPPGSFPAVSREESLAGMRALRKRLQRLRPRQAARRRG